MHLDAGIYLVHNTVGKSNAEWLESRKVGLGQPSEY